LKNNVKIDLKVVSLEGMDRINVAEGRDIWLALSESSNEL